MLVAQAIKGDKFMKRERVRSKHGFKGFRVFILGWLIGFISTLGIILGVGYWAYTSISVRRIEKWTKSDITDNKGIEDLTLEKTALIIKGIASNGSNAYTLAKLEEDFGITLFGDSIYGINTDIIKNSPIKDLSNAIDDTINTATFNNVLSFLGVEQDDMGLLDTILETEVTYYINNNKLYTNEEYTIEVGFDNYTINADTVEFANGTHTISTYNGVKSIKPRLSDLPLNTALNSMTDATHDLKIYEVMDYYYDSVNDKYYENYDEVTGVYSNEIDGIMGTLAGYTVEELSDNETFNGLYIYEVMGYERSGEEGNYIYTKDSEIVTGTMKAIAGKTIGELSDPETINGLYLYEVMGYKSTGNGNYTYIGENDQEQPVTGAMKVLAGKTIKQISDPDTINNLQVYEVMGYTREGEEGSYVYKNNGIEVTGFMKAIAGTTINQIDTTIETLKAVDLFDAETTTILKLFTTDELKGTNGKTALTIMDLPNAVADKINSVSVDELVTKGIITGVDTTTAYYETIKNLTLVELLNGSN